jgi:Uma2 family endonuclease
MSYAAYLAFERAAPTKHEYLRGTVLAMAGGSPEHARLAGSLARLIGNAIVDQPCALFSSDLRVRIVETDRSTYPDLTVICGRPQTAADDDAALVNPCLIVEILSDSTEADDRGEHLSGTPPVPAELSHYRRLPSLQDYVLVAQKTQRVEVYRRRGEQWILTEHGPGTSFELSSIAARIAVDDIYRDPFRPGSPSA